MFTGIVEGKGIIRDIGRRGDTLLLRIALPPQLTDIRPGDSISVDGSCLTVLEGLEREIVVEVSEETLSRTKISQYVPGKRVNLERAIRAGGRFGGHFVTGHVDGVGEVVLMERAQRTARLEVLAPEEVSPYLVKKGSVAVDGVSLTVNEVWGDRFQVMLIPYTLEHTTLGELRPGDKVNLEADILAKYVRKFLNPQGGVDEAFLAKHGFLDVRGVF